MYPTLGYIGDSVKTTVLAFFFFFFDEVEGTGGRAGVWELEERGGEAISLYLKLKAHNGKGRGVKGHIAVCTNIFSYGLLLHALVSRIYLDPFSYCSSLLLL